MSACMRRRRIASGASAACQAKRSGNAPRCQGDPEFRWGELWEWTGSPFEPYPGFAADAYREYSAPWFGTHQSVRGASFATPMRMRSARYRNFYLPERADMFVGFRTCAA